MTTLTATRLATLGAIRVVGWVVGVAAAASGVVYLIAVALGSPIWDGDKSSLVARPLPFALVQAFAVLIGCLTVAAIAFIVGDLAWRIRRRVVFAPWVSRAAWLIAGVLAVGSWVAHILATIAAHAALVYPDDVDPDTVDLGSLPIDWGITASSFLPDPALLGLAVAIGVLAYIVRSGEQLQHDVDGLV